MSGRRSHRIAVAVVIAAAAALIPSLASAATPTAATGSAQGGELTISNGSPWVDINGSWVDFHTDVRDLAWNPAGTKAVFVDSNGDLETANANGTGRVVATKHPAGVVLSHPTWETSPTNSGGYYPGNNLIFTAAGKTSSQLEWVQATAVNADPYTVIGLNGANWANAGANLSNVRQDKGSFVWDSTRTGDVYITDVLLRMQTTVLGQGSEPSLSPNGEEVVFVRSVSGHDHLFEETLSNHTVRDLTPHATTNYTEPTFSPNGATIAFRAPNGTYTLPSTGTHNPTKVTSTTGLVAYRG
ncbi:PD40 domain-containing protein [Streptacidiphilus sp. P02-A3a]|uniref:TolB family protein n=1 Tax=Streptacidiphilus sp. P02-A3a TaxID=2704468 RepID=UPI0015F815DD|nr:PD40 domain-containing protein [Streptacidiphilus sp. P02-A3a]QMU72854.1 hypothetical protein GXP74_36035 [Streptacidiphilus sp. P02-A3a]